MQRACSNRIPWYHKASRTCTSLRSSCDFVGVVDMELGHIQLDTLACNLLGPWSNIQTLRVHGPMVQSPIPSSREHLSHEQWRPGRAAGQVWLCPTRLSMALTGGSSAKSQQDVTEGFCIVETNYRVSPRSSCFWPVKQLQHEHGQLCLASHTTCWSKLFSFVSNDS